MRFHLKTGTTNFVWSNSWLGCPLPPPPNGLGALSSQSVDTQWILCFNWAIWTSPAIRREWHIPNTRTRSAEDTLPWKHLLHAVVLSHRHNSNFMLFDSQVMLLTLASCVWVHIWEPEGQVSDQWALWKTMYPLHWSQDSTDFPPKDIWRFSAHKTQVPPKTLLLKKFNRMFFPLVLGWSVLIKFSKY